MDVWETILSWLSNPWIVGIGGSTISGVIVWFITQKLFSTRENKEYVQKVLSANSEVLYALRPLISESAFPSSSVVESVISATSKKFGVKKESMNSSMQFFDELIKEVMDSNFIPPQKKIDFCNHLLDLKKDALSNAQPKASGTDLDPTAIAKRENMFNALSISIAMMASFTILFSSFTSIIPVANMRTSFTLLSSILTPIAAALLTAIFALAYTLWMREDGAYILKRIFTKFEGDEEDKVKKL